MEAAPLTDDEVCCAYCKDHHMLPDISVMTYSDPPGTFYYISMSDRAANKSNFVGPALTLKPLVRKVFQEIRIADRKRRGLAAHTFFENLSSLAYNFSLDVFLGVNGGLVTIKVAVIKELNQTVHAALPCATWTLMKNRCNAVFSEQSYELKALASGRSSEIIGTYLWAHEASRAAWEKAQFVYEQEKEPLAILDSSGGVVTDITGANGAIGFVVLARDKVWSFHSEYRGTNGVSYKKSKALV